MRSTLFILLLIISNLLLSQKNNIDIEQPIRKWQCSLGFLVFNENRKTPELLKKERQYIQLGIERQFLIRKNQFSIIVMAAYHDSERNSFYNYRTFVSREMVRYHKQIKSSFFKIFSGVKLDLNAKGKISPYLMGGLAISIPTQFERTFILPMTPINITDDLLVKQKVKAVLPRDRGIFVGLGLSIKLSSRLTLHINGQAEAYLTFVKLSDLIPDVELNGLGESIKVTPETLLYGLSLSRSF